MNIRIAALLIILAGTLFPQQPQKPVVRKEVIYLYYPPSLYHRNPVEQVVGQEVISYRREGTCIIMEKKINTTTFCGTFEIIKIK